MRGPSLGDDSWLTPIAILIQYFDAVPAPVGVMAGYETVSYLHDFHEVHLFAVGRFSEGNPNATASAVQIIGQPGYRKRLDYVLVGSWDAHPKAHAHVRSAALAFDKPVDGVWASDHFGLVVDLDVGMNGVTDRSCEMTH